MLNVRPGDEDTICAIATAPGEGAIAVVRVSGVRAVETARKILPFLPLAPESHKAYFGTLVSPDLSKGLVAVDEVLATVFLDGRSYTGEESIEISCHGGNLISGQILAALCTLGARLAKPGEFTYRAFLHGRIDLVQAESVLALIESRSAESSSVALAQLKGELSRRFAEIEDDLLWLGAQLEASIDFSSDGIEIKPSQDLLNRAQVLNARVDALLGSYKKGRVLRDGLAVALIGAPNAGKSSLLNALVEEEKAIVTSDPGTTRDLIEVETRFEGTPVRWIDSAGIREAQNQAEKQGVERSLRIRETADQVVVVIDLSQPNWRQKFSDFVRSSKRSIHQSAEIYAFNKTDLDRTGEWVASAEAEAERLGVGLSVLFVSAHSRSGIEMLKNLVAKPLRAKSALSETVILHSRHVEGLERIQTALSKSLELIKKDASPEIIAYELQSAVKVVHELLGKVFNEQVIDRIFKEFCLGK